MEARSYALEGSALLKLAMTTNFPLGWGPLGRGHMANVPLRCPTLRNENCKSGHHWAPSGTSLVAPERSHKSVGSKSDLLPAGPAPINLRLCFLRDRLRLELKSQGRTADIFL